MAANRVVSVEVTGSAAGLIKANAEGAASFDELAAQAEGASARVVSASERQAEAAAQNATRAARTAGLEMRAAMDAAAAGTEEDYARAASAAQAAADKAAAAWKQAAAASVRASAEAATAQEGDAKALADAQAAAAARAAEAAKLAWREAEAAATQASGLMDGEAFGDKMAAGATKAGGAFKALDSSLAGWGIPFSASVGRIGEKFAEAETAGQKFSQFMTTLGGVALAAGTAAFAVIGAESIKAASTFQADMELIHTQAGAAQSEVQKMSGAVLALAGPTAQAPDKLADALYHVESAGYRGAKALDIVKVAAQGATTGHASLVDVTNALDAALVVGIPGVENYSQAMGRLNAIVGSGDMHMQDLADAFGGPMLSTVKNFGLSLNDVGAALAVFGDSNIRGADAATQLRMAVMSLAQPGAGPHAAAAMKELGLSFDTMRTEMQQKGLLATLEDLRSRLSAAGVTGTQTAGVLTDLFTKRGGMGVDILINQLDRMKQKYTEIQAGAHNFGADWASTTQTFAFRMRSVGDSLQALGIRFGEWLIPKVEAAGSAVEKVTNFFLAHKTVLEAVAGTIGGVLALAITKFLAVQAIKFTQWVLEIPRDIAKAVTAIINWSTATVSESAAAALATEDAAGGISGAAAKIDESMGTVAAGAEGTAAKFDESMATMAASAEGTAAKVAAAQGEMAGAEMGAGAAAGAAGAEAGGAGIMGALGPIGAGAAAATVALPPLFSWLDKIKSEAAQAGTAYTQKFLKSVQGTPDAIQHALDKLQALEAQQNKSPSVLQSIWSGIMDLDPLSGVRKKDDTAKYQAEVETLTKSLQGMANWQQISTQATRGAGDAIATAANSFGLFEQHVGVDAPAALSGFGRAALGAISPTDTFQSVTAQLGVAQASLAENTQAVTTDLGKFVTALQNVSGNDVSAFQATDQYFQSLDALSTALKTNKDQFSGHTTAAINDRDALNNAVTSILGTVSAMAKQGDSYDTIRGKLQTNVAGLVNVMKQAGLTQGQIEQLLGQYHLLPSQIDTLIKQSGIADAIGNVRNLKGLIDSLQSKKIMIQIGEQVSTVAGTVQSFIGSAFAGGGMVTNQPTVLVGEGGPHPEFVIPTDPQFRANAHALTGDLIKRIGMPAMASGGILSNTIELDGVSNAVDLKGGIASLANAAIAGQVNSLASSLLPPAGPSGPASGIAALAQQMAASMYGWTGLQWTYLNDVEMREAGWSLSAKNPSSNAYGLAQFINGPGEYAQYGGNATTAAGQITGFLNYVKQRYGTPAGAWAHELQFGWYDRGGPVHPGLTMVANGTGADEYILTPKQLSAVLAAGDGRSGPQIHNTYQITIQGSADQATLAMLPSILEEHDRALLASLPRL